jgi:hypothetical protein
MKHTKGLALLSFIALFGLVVPLGGGAGCSSEECSELSCSELSGDASNGQVFTMCEDAGEGYVRLDDEDGEEVYECFCDTDFMRDAAKRICTEGAVCRKAGSACESSGDCCAGLHCTYNVCG